MFNKLFFSLFFLSSFILCQSELEKGVVQYNLRHSGCVENKAKSEPIAKAISYFENALNDDKDCLLYTSPSPRDATLSRMPSSA